MANLWLEGFDHYGEGATGVTNMLAGGYAEVSSMQPSTVNPRTGTYCLRNTDALNDEFIRKELPSLRQTVFIGVAHIVEELPGIAATHSIFQVRNVSNTPLATVVLMTTGGIEVREGDVNGTVIAQGDPIVPANEWVFIEAMFDRAAGTVECRVNGVVAVSATGVDMGLDAFAQVTIGPVSVAAVNRNYAIDDLRIGDDLTGVNDDFMGDRRVFYFPPTADGSPQEWTPDTGTDAYARIDEVGPDGDTSYIESTAAGSVARVTFADLPAGVVGIGGIAFVNYAKKTDTGTADFANNVISGAVRGLGAEVALGASYGYLDQQHFDLDPDGDIPWTAAAVNAIESELEHVGGS